MADNIKKRTFEIEILGVKESVSNLETLEQVLDKMEKQVDNINKNGGFTVVSKEANKNTKEAIDLAKAEEIAQGEVISSYKEKQKALSTLGKEIKSMTTADAETTKRQQELIGEYNELNQTLKRFDASMGNHQRNVGDYRGALKEAKDELKNLQGQMVGLDQHSAQFKALATEAGNLKDRINDVNDAIKREASDTKSLDAVIDYAKSATAAFQLYKGAMSAFGLETKEAEEAMQQLVGAMNIVQSLQTLSETFKSTSATGQLLHKMLQMVGLEAKTTAAATTALSTAENTATVATKGLNVGLKATKLALASLGIGLVIMLVSELVEHWEDLVGWVNKLIPGLSKTGGLMNNLKGIVVGLGKAVVNWLINPWKTFANVIGKILSGDFEGAMKAAQDGIKNQFKGTVDAFNKGYKDQIETGLEDIARKNAAVQDKILTHNKNMITKQKNADGTYRKEYIEANKKMFENRKKMYKKDSDEYRKVLEDEAAFNQQIEDAKTAAAKKGASERAKAAKDAAKEAAEAAKAEAEELKRQLTTERELAKAITDRDILEQKIEERKKQRIVEGYNAGPVETFEKKLEDLYAVQKKISDLELANTITDLSESLSDNVKNLSKANKTWQEYVNNAFYGAKEAAIKEFGKTEKEASIIALKFVKNTDNIWQQFLLSLVGKTEKEATDLINTLGLNKADLNVVLAGWQKIQGLILKSEDETNANIIDKENKMLATRKAELADFADDFQRRYKLLIDKVNAIGGEQVERNNIWGTVQTGKTLANLDILKAQWEEAYVDLSAIIKKEEERWNQYLENVKNIYGEDSSAFKKAQKEKADALDPLFKKLDEVGKRANTPTSTETDYTGDNNAGASTKPKRKLWHGKGDKKQDGSEFSLIDNLANLFDSLDEMVLAPAMDTFQMYMDFAIEETQAKLEYVQELHDEALDKVEESTNRINELNDSLKDSSNDNLEATKQQLADEQLLYAQRLAEEQKLAEREKDLKNKANEQEYQSRKMELGYNMVQAIVNTAMGASKALGQWGWPLGPIFAGVMAALGAVQVALIAKQMGSLQKPRKLAEGGLLEGPSHKQGGIRIPGTNVEVEGKEFVVNKRATKKFLPLLEAINAEGKKSISNTDKRIRRFANGGQVNFDKVDSNLRQNADTSKILGALDKIDFNPVVSVVDFEKVQNRLVKVRSLAGR